MIPGLPVLLVLLAISSSTDAAEDEMILKPGAYSVDVDLRLPHVGMAGAKSKTTICVTSEGSRGLAVLSGNNPLANCPISNLDEDGTRLTFDIVCAGPNAPRASAMYTLGPEAFHGRITMNMGGKNMTMTEMQDGLREGSCPK